MYAVLLGILIQATDLSKKIDYTTTGQPATTALAGLSRQAGIGISIETGPGKNVLVLRFKSVPLKDALDRIATVTVTDWRIDKDGTIAFYRSSERAQKERERVVQERFTRMRDALNKRLAEISRNGEFTEDRAKATAAKIYSAIRVNGRVNPDYDRLQDPRLDLPRKRLAVQAVAAINLRLVAAADANYPVIFATRPSPLERPFSPGLDGKIASYGAAQAMLAKAYLRLLGANELSDDIGIAAEPREDPDLDQIVVSATRSYDTIGGSAIVSFVNKLGYVAGQEVVDLDNFSSDSDKAQDSADRIPVSLEASQLCALVQSGRRRQRRIIKPELAKLFFRPDEVDPLSIFHGEVLVRIAERGQKNLCANLGDLAFGSCIRFDPDHLMAATFLEWLAVYGHELADVESWLMVKPGDVIDDEQKQVPRAALRIALAETAKTGFVSIDSRCALAASTPKAFYSQMSTMLLGCVTTRPSLSTEFMINRFYGLLSPAALRSLTSGDRLNFVDMSTELRNLVAEMTYSNNWPTFTVGPPPDEHGINDLPTRCLADGISSQGWVELKVESKPILWAANSRAKDSKADPAPHFPESYGYIDETTLDQYWVGTSRKLTFTFYLSDRVTAQNSMTEYSYDHAKAPMKFADLPETMRKEIKAAQDAEKGG